jgi:hypothetical protein
MSKRILIVGNSAPWAIENFYQNHLKNLGYKVELFNVSEFYNTKSIIERLRFKLMDLSLFKQVNVQLLAYCERVRPDIIWVFKGIEIYPETLMRLNIMGVFLVNYNPDHPFLRSSPSHGGINIEHSIPFYNLLFSYRKDLVTIFREKYCKPAEVLPFGYELKDSEFNRLKVSEQFQRVCFIGMPDKERTAILLYLARMGFKIDIFSELYYNKKVLACNNNIILNKPAYGDEFWRTIMSYRVQLNFLRKHNKNSHNQRTFEVPGAGGVLLTEFSDEQSDFFNEGREIFFFRSVSELPDQISSVLALSKDDSIQLRINARKRSEEHGYSYEERAKIVHRQLELNLL